MAATPKPIRKKVKEHAHEDKEFLRKHNPQPTKQLEKKILKKHAKTSVKLNVHETPKHEKIRKERMNAAKHMKSHGG